MLSARYCALPFGVLAGCGLLAGCGGPPKKQAKRQELSAREIVKRYMPAIVRIENNLGDQVGVGTGFLVSESGRIATNWHVIAGAGTLKVHLADGSEHAVPRVVAWNRERDLAVIEIDVDKKMPTLPIGNSDQVVPGDSVIAIGNPLHLDFTVSDGLISSVRPMNDNVFLQFSAPISPGSSGGPLFNNFGEVIGVATMIAEEGQNLNFGVPSNYLRPLLAQKDSKPIAEFSKEFPKPAQAAKAAAHSGSGVIMRQIPNHDPAILDACNRDEVVKVFEGINRAVELGAPLYNDGDHEACYNIYKQTASHFEKDESLCKGLRDAFGDGLLRAETRKDATGKAWAMRDTLDGILSVILRKAQGQALP